VRAIPPSCRDLVLKWNIIVSPLHYVPDVFDSRKPVQAGETREAEQRAAIVVLETFIDRYQRARLAGAR